jgi:Arc/MetJ-type ribon-helix-helix transcriptional regulator
MGKRVIVPVPLPEGLVKKIDELVKRGMFSSRAEALRYGARLLLLVEGRVHERGEEYAYEMIKERLERRVPRY